MADPAQDLEKLKATVFPSGLTYICPVCGAREDLLETELTRAPDGSAWSTEQKIRCGECDWLIEVGHIRFQVVPAQCDGYTIKRRPSRADVLDFASRALRNAPHGTVTPDLLNALVDDIKDGLHCLAPRQSEMAK